MFSKSQIYPGMLQSKEYPCSALTELLENVDGTKIMDFIKEINFYHVV